MTFKPEKVSEIQLPEWSSGDPLTTAKERLQWEKAALGVATKLVGYTKSSKAIEYIITKVRQHLDVPVPLTACEVKYVNKQATCKLVKGHQGPHFDPDMITAWKPEVGAISVAYDGDDVPF